MPARLSVVLSAALALFASAAAAQNQTQTPQQAQPQAQAPAAAPAVPMDVPGAAALLALYNPGKANPLAKSTYAALVITVPNSTRTQQIFASGQVYTWRGVKVRELWSYVYRFTGSLDPALAQRLLADTDQQLPGGSWVVLSGAGDTRLIAFESFVQADAPAATAAYAIIDTAQHADKLELELTSKDEF